MSSSPPKSTSSSPPPTANRCLVLKSFGEPLVIEERPIPLAEPGSAVVRIYAAGLAPYAADVFNGATGPLPLPLVPGGTAVGRVHALGADAVALRLGQLVLLDAPGVLGWAGFREISLRYGLGMTEQLLAAAIQSGEIPAQPTRPLATVMIGALDEAAMSIANADDPAQEKADVQRVVHTLLDGLLSARS